MRLAESMASLWRWLALHESKSRIVSATAVVSMLLALWALQCAALEFPTSALRWGCGGAVLVWLAVHRGRHDLLERPLFWGAWSVLLICVVIWPWTGVAVTTPARWWPPAVAAVFSAVQVVVCSSGRSRLSRIMLNLLLAGFFVSLVLRLIDYLHPIAHPRLEWCVLSVAHLMVGAAVVQAYVNRRYRSTGRAWLGELERAEFPHRSVLVVGPPGSRGAGAMPALLPQAHLEIGVSAVYFPWDQRLAESLGTDSAVRESSLVYLPRAYVIVVPLMTDYTWISGAVSFVRQIQEIKSDDKAQRAAVQVLPSAAAWPAGLVALEPRAPQAAKESCRKCLADALVVADLDPAVTPAERIKHDGRTEEALYNAICGLLDCVPFTVMFCDAECQGLKAQLRHLVDSQPLPPLVPRHGASRWLAFW